MDKLSTEQTTNEQTVTTVGTTQFVTEEITQEQIFNDTNYQTGTAPIRDQGIVDFLSKPQIISTIDWNASALPNTVLFQVRPEDILTTYPIYADKFKGFGLIRGTCVVRLVLNAEPFHAGKLICSFIPCEGEGGDSSWRQSCLNQKSQQPNVELDCRDSEAVIKLPYIAPTDYYNIKDNSIGWGLLTLSVLSSLTTGSGGPSVVNVTAFAHFEDFEMAAPMKPQSGAGAIKKYDRPKKAVSTSNSDKEASIMEDRSVSKALMMGSTVLSKVAEIPMLTPLAQPASWVFRGLSGVASWFGWSKPYTDGPQQVVTRKFIPNMANSSGACTTSILAMYHDNAVDIMPHMSGSGIDEMSLDYLKHVKAFASRFTISTTTAVDTLLYTKYVGPKFLGEYKGHTGTIFSYNSNSFPPGAYLAHFFALWRGGVKIHLKFVKTDYHSGRVLVTYTPGTAAVVPTTVGDTTYSLREIVDIRGNSDVTLELPYLLNVPYISTDDMMGTLNIMVLNELRAPTTVAQTIDVLVYFSFCGDYELAIPGVGLPSTSGGDPPLTTLPFVPQYSPPEKLVDDVIGGYVCPSFDMGPSRTCIGETFTSIKQLLNKYTTLWTRAPVSTLNGFVCIYPYTMSVCIAIDTTGDISVPAMYGDALSNFACGYAFMRGGVRLAVSQAVNTNPSLYGMSFMDYSVDQESAVTYFDNVRNPAVTYGTPFDKIINMPPVQYHDASPFFEIAVPYYNATHSSVVQCIDGSGYPISSTQPRARIGLGFPGADNYKLNISRACSDEFQLSYFLGFPPIMNGRTAL